MNGSRLGIVRTVHQASDAGMNQRSRTHRARFNCSKQFAVAQTVITEVLSRRTQRDDLGVRAWIVVAQVAIPAPSAHASAIHNHGSDRHFSAFEGALSRA